MISGAAREGARAGAVQMQGNRVARATQNAEKAVYLPKTGPNGATYFTSSDVKVVMDQETITVSVTYHQPSYLPLLGALLGGGGAKMTDTVPLTARATFWLEKGRT